MKYYTAPRGALEQASDKNSVGLMYRKSNYSILSKKITGMRSKLLSGKFFYLDKLLYVWAQVISLGMTHECIAVMVSPV